MASYLVLLLLVAALAASAATRLTRGSAFLHPAVYRRRARPNSPQWHSEVRPARTAWIRTAVSLSLSLRVHDLDGLTVDQLKDALRRRGLPLSGRKVDLLSRLRADIAQGQREDRPGWMLNLEGEEEGGLVGQGVEGKDEEEGEETLEDRLVAALAAEVNA
ncbi:hypothetical protein NGA_0236620 [Nannochloropsis gaditana CCMP526]|uniref:uncharacterized protein n=1 Tax=Nannochloropsis gaditana (strain CCMP526) TaxID=1093141 RepID=UPI00029F78D4|nr:hypothetical protein NGA_0236620 [Nannochloropsis gaditana CCMP526]EKU20577.1 hypothetical protein NGA_0236620 [Nannochloropsis gaditana CCMP526]|eukprot:XP_005855773.1 hypothetical protein NGA_0236620 [Nannochloropsis gaditana CCMP526]